MTSQMYLDSYTDAGVLVSMALANDLVQENVDAHAVLTRILAFDPPSLAMLKKRDAPAFVALAHELREVFANLDDEDLDAAANRLNEMLKANPAYPHLSKDAGVWRLHHHPSDAALLPMYTSICAEGLARIIGGGYADRFGICDAHSCNRVFFDNSKNGTRRFCSVTCQNRVKTAAFRMRQSDAQVRAKRRR